VRWELVGFGRAAASVRAEAALMLREICGFGGPPTLLHLFEPPAYRVENAEYVSRKARAKDRFLAALLPGSVRRAALVTAGSEETSEWLKARLGLDAPVVPGGIDHFFRELGPSPPGADPYFLHLDSGDPRENTPLVLEAMCRVPEEALLVLAGVPESHKGAIVERTRALGIDGQVEVRGWVSDEELRSLYRGAVALVQPSRYEGFAGYPAVEALCQGTPVISLRAPGSRPLEGIAILIEHEDPVELAVSMRGLLTDGALRSRLGAVGRTWAAGLTWDKSAARFLELLHQVSGTRGR